MDITANFCSLLELYQTWSGSNKDYNHTEWSIKVNHLTFKHQYAINELAMMKF